MRLFGAIAKKLRLELVALADVDREDLVGEPGLFEEYRDLVAVRRGPVIEIDHGAFLSLMRMLGQLDAIACNSAQRQAQVNGGGRHRGELIGAE
jgi:hypothetical protein